MDLKNYKHTSFSCASQMLHFVLIEGKSLPQQKDYDVLLRHLFYYSGLEPNLQYLWVKNTSYISKWRYSDFIKYLF